MAMRVISFRSELCTACRACEVACSFARLGEFRPDTAGVAVRFDRLTGAVNLAFRAECDGCPEALTPVCVAYCPPGALVVEG